MALLVDPEIEERVGQLRLPFNRYGLDKYGISREHLVRFYTALGWFYEHYFRVRTAGIEHVPDEGRALLIGNHSGGLPVDAGMVITSLLLDHEPPRHCHAMVEYFVARWPFVANFYNRVGQFTGLPEHARRFLEDDRVVVAFPEGARGVGKLYRDRYTLVRFGTGFMRLAMSTNTPIVPFAFIGGEEAIATMFHLKRLAKLVGAPYIPVPPQIVPLPLPVRCAIHYGAPMVFEGDGNESDQVINDNVEQVKHAIRTLIAEGLEARKARR